MISLRLEKMKFDFLVRTGFEREHNRTT